MTQRKHLTIGLFGFGTVGRALFDLIATTRPEGVSIKRICVRSGKKNRGVEADFTTDPEEIFRDPEINLIVELIDDAEASLSIITRALREGLTAVSGNKKMLAHHLPELIELQKKTGGSLLYDASACGSIPVIRNLEEYYDNDLLISVKGILNGSSNYILTKVFKEGISYDSALRQAQEAGFAESDPSLDVDGWDALSKLVIITVHAFGTYVAPERIFTFGISALANADIRFANEKNRRIKLVGHVEKLADGRLCMCVIPQLLSRDKYIYGVDDEFNGVVIKGLCYDKQFMFGRGAGGFPTGSAILSDITASQYGYSYEYKKRNAHSGNLPSSPTTSTSESTIATTAPKTSTSLTSTPSAKNTPPRSSTTSWASPPCVRSSLPPPNCAAAESSSRPIPVTDPFLADSKIFRNFGDTNAP